MDLYQRLKTDFLDLIDHEGWRDEPLMVTARVLSPEEAIGRPKDQDYPIVKGRERMVEAEFQGAKGQAFTDQPGDFSGTLQEIAEMDLTDNRRRAYFVAAINAVLRRQGRAQGTVHCRDESPVLCADRLAEHIEEKYGRPKVALVGLQPRMVQALSRFLEVRVLDLDEDNIGQTRFGVRIEGPEATDSALSWCDLALVTGSTLSNATTMGLLRDKPTIFFGVTVAGPAVLLGLDRFCPYGL